MSEDEKPDGIRYECDANIRHDGESADVDCEWKILRLETCPSASSTTIPAIYVQLLPVGPSSESVPSTQCHTRFETR